VWWGNSPNKSPPEDRNRRPDGSAVFCFSKSSWCAEQKSIMNSPKIVLRINAANPNHHLYNNNGTWWCHYTEHRPDFTKHRIRMSLQTPSLPAARAKRDHWFSEIQRAIV